MQKSQSDATFDKGNKLPELSETAPSKMWSNDKGHDNSFNSTMPSRQAQTEAFFERQLLHPRVKWRRQMAQKQKMFVEQAGFADDAAFWGAKGVDGFRAFLRSRFGSVVGGWRHGLDQDGNGKLSKFEFTNACRAMGYHGKLKTLWKQLDDNDSGFISLQELDPESGQAIVNFKKALIDEYGNMITAWTEGLDTNGNGTLDEQELIDFCKKINFEIDGKKLFKWLQPEIGRKKMTLKDLDPKAWDSFNAGDLTMKYAGASTEWLRSSIVELPPLADGESEVACESISMSQALSTSALPDITGDGTESQQKKPGRNTRLMNDASAARKWRMSLARREMEAVKENIQELSKMRCGLHKKEGFKNALLVRCGSILGAWKYSLDLDGNGRISEGEFALALRRLGFHGNIRTLWRELDQDHDGLITLGDLDEETYQLLTEFTDAAESHYGNLLLCWIKGMDAKGTGKCTEDTFAKICKEIGYSGNPNRLFRLMQPEAGRRFLTLRDLDTRSYDAFSRGDFRMLKEVKKDKNAPRKSKKEMGFHERQSQCFFHTFRDGQKEAANYASACRLSIAPPQLIDTLAEFKELLWRKYGSMMGAWRNLLDADGSGKITFMEFCQAARSVGYGGNLKALWAELDEDNSGFISLKELDPDTYELVEAFNKFLHDKYGSLTNAWLHGFGKGFHARMDEENFIRKLKKIGWEGEGHKLFKCLVPEAGRNFCNIRDLDPEQEHTAKKRGHHKKDAPDSDDNVEAELKSPHGATAGSDKKFGGTGELSVKGELSSSLYTPINDAPGPYGCGSLDALRKHLVKIYGSTVAAWRAAFDKPKRGRIHFGNFAVALQDAHFAGSAKKLWAALAGGCGEPLGAMGTGGFARLSDLDAKAAKTLATLRDALLLTHGSIVDSWWLCLDIHGAGRVEEADFSVALTKLNPESAIANEKPKYLFKLLTREWGIRTVSLEDLEVLLLDVPVSERKKVWGGVEAEPLSPRALITQDLVKEANRMKGAASLEDFKRALVNQYGSLYAAWRKGLDVDRNGIITQADFAKGCRAIGYTGNAKKLWEDLDKNKNGQIELKEIDPDVGEMVGKFEGLLKDQFGSVLAGWKKGLDQDSNRRLDQEEFVEKIKTLGFEGNAKRLFKLLQPEAGRKFITLDDLGPDERRAAFYGDNL